MATNRRNEEFAEINPGEKVLATIRIEGDTPLIVHRWSQKAKIIILEKQIKATKVKARDPKNPVEDFIESLYWISGKPTEYTEEAFEKAVSNGARFGFPVTAIKQAAICSAYRNGLTKDMKSLRGTFFIESEGPELLAEIKGSSPEMREDMVRVSMGAADIRYRGMFQKWYMDLTIKFNKNGIYTLEQLVNLINLGGFSCGIGDWRPERDGQYGMFHVVGTD